MKNKTMLSIIAAAIAAGSVPAAAQDAIVAQESITVTEMPASCGVKYYNTWRDGWFIQAGGGINLPVMEGFREKKHIGATYNLGFGRWFSPYFGFRFSGYYGNNTETLEGSTMHYRSASVNTDIMWDLCNSIGGVNLNRPVSIIPFVGIGADYVYHFDGASAGLRNVYDGEELRTSSWTLPVSAGLQVRFRLCKYVDFFLEGRASFAGDNFNNLAADTPVDIAFQATGGLTFNIGGKSFQTYDPCSDAAYISALNNQVNDLRDELAVTTAALAAAESQLPCPEAKPAPAPVTVVEAAPMLTTVRFTINSAKVTPMEMVNVYNVAEYMKAHPASKITITGYADKDTGSSTYNQKLSERRAQAVYDILVNNYGISADRLVKAAEGSSQQPYDTNNWNRIVIFSQD